MSMDGPVCAECMLLEQYCCCSDVARLLDSRHRGEAMTLLPCPWCGRIPDGLELSEGTTYRWALVTPRCCGSIQGEIRRSGYPSKLGTDEDNQAAIAWWNDRYQADGGDEHG